MVFVCIGYRGCVRGGQPRAAGEHCNFLTILL